MSWNWRKAYARLGANFLISFFSPLMGTTVVLNVDFLDAVLVGIISSVIVTGFAGGKMLDEWSKTKC